MRHQFKFVRLGGSNAPQLAHLMGQRHFVRSMCLVSAAMPNDGREMVLVMARGTVARSGRGWWCDVDGESHFLGEFSYFWCTNVKGDVRKPLVYDKCVRVCIYVCVFVLPVWTRRAKRWQVIDGRRVFVIHTEYWFWASKNLGICNYILVMCCLDCFGRTKILGI